MNKVLKKMTLKTLSPMIIIAAVLAVVFLAVSCQGVFTMLAGPTPLVDADLENLEGEYISFDASEIIVAFATLSLSGENGTEVLETYYLLPAGDGTYLAVMDAKEAHENVLERAMDQSHEYYLGDLEMLTRLGTIQGTASKLEDDMESYMTECITNYSLPGYDADSLISLIRPVQINLDKVGFLYANTASLLAVIGLVFLAVMLLVLIPALTGAYQKKAIEAVTENVTAEDAQQAFDACELIERIRVGDYIWYQKGASTKVLKTETIVWGYSMPEPLVVSKYRWPVALYDTQQNFTQICFMEKKNREKFLAAIAAQGHPFIDNYTSALSQLFKSNFDGFMKEAARAAKERTES